MTCSYLDLSNLVAGVREYGARIQLYLAAAPALWTSVQLGCFSH